jgi:SdiA-regulated protein
VSDSELTSRNKYAAAARTLLSLIALALVGLGSAPPQPAASHSLDRSGSHAPTVSAEVDRVIHTSKFKPPSPDPAGITYDASRDRLIVSDSEVDEMPLYRGVNLFVLTRRGTVVARGRTLPYSSEPTGVGVAPGDRTLYASDDYVRRVFIFRAGADRRYGTGDDIVSSFVTTAFGCRDPEDLAFDHRSRHLFIADGDAAKVFDVDPVNGIFGDGNDRVSHFSVRRYGVKNVEGLGLDAERHTLLVVADREREILEVTTAGALVRIISLAAITHPRWISDVTTAPASDPDHDRPARTYWITDRQRDNKVDPREDDGKIYEVSLP